MSKNYTQLRKAQRYQIDALLKAGMNQKQIAAQLQVHPSTICRELKRNSAKRGSWAGKYRADTAEERTRQRHKEKAKHSIFTEEMKQTIVHYLKEDKWSPQIISSCVESVTVSHEWIYQWIWKCKLTNTKQTRSYRNVYKYLRHAKRKQKRGNIKEARGVIPNRTPIEQRPSIVKKRTRVGDIEVDLMIGKSNRGALLVMTDRATLQTHLRKLPTKESSEVYKGIVSVLQTKNYPTYTLTFDNDKAFTCHTAIAKEFNLKTYFTRPYTSQDKGTVENRIGVVRRFVPKKTNLTFVTEKMVEDIESKINNRPIKKFNYLSSNQVLIQKLHL